MTFQEFLQSIDVSDLRLQPRDLKSSEPEISNHWVFKGPKPRKKFNCVPVTKEIIVEHEKIHRGYGYDPARNTLYEIMLRYPEAFVFEHGFYVRFTSEDLAIFRGLYSDNVNGVEHGGFHYVFADFRNPLVTFSIKSILETP